MLLSKEDPRITLGQWYKAFQGEEVEIGKPFIVVAQRFFDEDLDEVKRIEEHNRKVMESGTGDLLDFPDREITVSFNGVPSSEELKQITDGDKSMGAVITRNYVNDNCIRDMEKLMEVEGEEAQDHEN